jgi:hypothetical protein
MELEVSHGRIRDGRLMMLTMRIAEGHPISRINGLMPFASATDSASNSSLRK